MRCMWNLVTLILLSAKPNQLSSAQLNLEFRLVKVVGNVTQLPRFGFLFFFSPLFPPLFPPPPTPPTLKDSILTL